MTDNMRNIRLGIIGTHSIAQEHIKHIVDIPAFQISALGDINKKHLDEACDFMPYQPATYQDYQKLLDNEDLDAAVIATPNHLHKEMTIAAFDAGLHVFCEKPMAPTVEECEEMLEAQKKTGKFLQIGMHRRYNPLYIRTKEIIDSGEVGELKMLWGHEFRGDWKILSDDPEKNARINWRYSQEKSGGTSVEKLCHDMDVFNWLIGKSAKNVYGSGGVGFYTEDGRDTADNLMLVGEYEGGVRTNFVLSLFTPHMSYHGRHYGIVGTEGNLEIFEQDFLIRKYYRESQSHENIYVDDLGWKEEGGHPASVAQWRAFAKSVKENTPPFCNGEKGRDAVKICRACEESMRTGEVVDI